VVSAIRIYVEGDRQLRRGFHRFFSALIAEAREKRVAFDIITCGPRGEAYNRFKLAEQEYTDGFNLLLVDSEEEVRETESPRAHLARVEGWDLRGVAEEQVHLMAQTMETWFLAEPDVLSTYFGKDFAVGALPRRADVEAIPKADVESALKRAVASTKMGRYHKVVHGSEILGRLNPDRVRSRAPHCDRLFETILKYLGVP
jgi:DNA polymerase elongation subunit (family B)